MTRNGRNDDRSKMRRRDENPDAGGAAPPWTRRALVSLWVIAFALLGGGLAVRWDALMTSLAGAPSANGGGAER
jgi:hypothetical protein